MKIQINKKLIYENIGMSGLPYNIITNPTNDGKPSVQNHSKSELPHPSQNPIPGSNLKNTSAPNQSPNTSKLNQNFGLRLTNSMIRASKQ